MVLLVRSQRGQESRSAARSSCFQIVEAMGPKSSDVKNTLLNPNNLPGNGEVLKVRKVRRDSFSPINPKFRRRVRRRRRRCRRTGDCGPDVPPEPTPDVTVNPDFPAWGVDEIDGAVDGARCPADSPLGEGVDIYIVDTGCEPDTNALCLNFLDGSGGVNGCADDNNHGSHVAGIATSEEFGLAIKETRHCVKVLNQFNSGTDSDAAQAVVHVTNHAATTGPKSVINLSLGITGPSLMDDAIAAIISPDIYVVTSAGNLFFDACQFAPARSTLGNDQAITVQVHDIDGNFASFSNSGDCTDISAPGFDIISDSMNPMDSLISSGTRYVFFSFIIVQLTNFASISLLPLLFQLCHSQAAPPVTVAIAVLLSEGKPVNVSSLSGSRTIGDRPNRSKPGLQISCGI